MNFEDVVVRYFSSMVFRGEVILNEYVCNEFFVVIIIL